jgi:hypothetical protein
MPGTKEHRGCGCECAILDEQICHLVVLCRAIKKVELGISHHLLVLARMSSAIALPLSSEQTSGLGVAVVKSPVARSVLRIAASVTCHS